MKIKKDYQLNCISFYYLNVGCFYLCKKTDCCSLGHSGEVGCIVFHPEATRTLSKSACCLASCDRLGCVKLWSLERFFNIMYLRNLNM